MGGELGTAPALAIRGRPDMSLVFLIGMPGVGKTHWGRIWSLAHDFRFYDLDVLIERAAGRTIPSLIKDDGEAAFRALESEVLIDTVDRNSNKNAIISCGGGTPTIERNLRLMLDAGCIVYLQASTERILKQLQSSHVRRPLLKQMSVEGLNTLLEKRKYFYEQAHFSLPLENAEVGTFAEIIELCLNRHS
jgi:shikimate kinase